MRNRQAVAITVALALLSLAGVYAFLGDGAFQSIAVPPGREFRAALAIRDDVTPFQKWGTFLFTRRYLTRYYDAAWYFTQAGRKDKKEEFLSCLDTALQRYPVVDLFLLAHTNKYVDWVEALPEDHRRHLRLVYNTGCHNLPQGQYWLALGAKTYIGHPGVSESPFFYYYFLRRWVRGRSLQQALDESNVLACRKFQAVEALSLGYLNAEWLIRESWASCRGNTRLRIEDGHQ